MAGERRKKMVSKKKAGARVYSVTEFSWPRLHTGKCWFVDFLCYDPVEGKMRRKKYHLDGIKKLSDRRKRAAELIAKLSDKLQHGWNVWAEKAENIRQYTLYEHVSEFYCLYLDKMEKAGSIKQSTHKRCLSYYKVFNEWLSKVRAEPVVYVYQFKMELVSDFLDYVFLDLDVSARTRNNYLVWLSTYCSWMKEKNYIPENPCLGVKKLKEEPKKREPLSAQMLARLREHLLQENKHYLLACMMEYYAFIRPNELTHVKIGDIHLKAQKIIVHGEFTKNGKDGAIGLNAEVIRLMVELGVFKHVSSEYLFGTRSFMPGAKKQSGRIFRERFQKLRKELGWKDCYQFYSLKDTGIRDLANADGFVVARDQARHSDISTTNKYLKGDALTVHEETKHFKGGL